VRRFRGARCRSTPATLAVPLVLAGITGISGQLSATGRAFATGVAAALYPVVPPQLATGPARGLVLAANSIAVCPGGCRWNPSTTPSDWPNFRFGVFLVSTYAEASRTVGPARLAPRRADSQARRAQRSDRGDARPVRQSAERRAATAWHDGRHRLGRRNRFAPRSVIAESLATPPPFPLTAPGVLSGGSPTLRDNRRWRSRIFGFCRRVFFWPPRKSLAAFGLRVIVRVRTRSEVTKPIHFVASPQRKTRKVPSAA